MQKNYQRYNSDQGLITTARKLDLHKLIIIVPAILIFLIGAFFVSSIHGSNESDYSIELSSSSIMTSVNEILRSVSSSNNSNAASTSSNSLVLGIEMNQFCADISQKVDKTNSLSESYVPANLILLTKLKTDKQIQIRSEVLKDLASLFDDAKKSGLNLQVISGYRSYQTQITLFNSYVAQEKSNGLSETDAIAKANTYSAKPGHSEHQLGTVVDVSLAGSSNPFNLTSAENLKLFNYLEQSVSKFNFKISYPKDNNFGYQYEPWHLRWIDKECN